MHYDGSARGEEVAQETEQDRARTSQLKRHFVIALPTSRIVTVTLILLNIYFYDRTTTPVNFDHARLPEKSWGDRDSRELTCRICTMLRRPTFSLSAFPHLAGGS